MNRNVRIVLEVWRILVMLRWLPGLMAYNIPRSGVYTLGSLMSVPPLPTHHQLQDPHYHNPPNILLQPALVTPSPATINATEDDDRIDRSYKARKVVYKYKPKRPVRYGHPKTRVPSLHPKFYTAYSEWSRCDVFCRKRRERYCIVRSKCGFHVHIEERDCHYRLCAPLSIPSSYYKKKKRIIVADYDDEDDEYYDDDDTEYVVIKKHPKRKRKRPHIIYERREEPIPANHRPSFDDEYEQDRRHPGYHEPIGHPTEQRIQNQRPSLGVVVDDFDDQKIFHSKLQHHQRFTATQNFHRRPPQTPVVQRKPSRLTSYFEDYYDNLFRDGTGFSNRHDDIQDFDGFQPVSEYLRQEKEASGEAITTEQPLSTEFNMLMESFPTGTPEVAEPRHTKREISNFLEDSDEDSTQDQSEESIGNSTVEYAPDGKKYPEKSMLKLGVAAQKRSREKAVFEMPRKVDNPYSKWSRWSKCTAKCTTRRFKRCKVPSICGNDIIREVAYCYTEGSFCEEWIGNQLYQNNKSPPAIATTTGTTPKPTKPPRQQNALVAHHQSARSRSDVDQDNSIAQPAYGNRRSFLQPEYMPQEITCGLPMMRTKSKKYMYNMLRIIGGKTSKRGQWPWQVAILNRFKEAFCGGTLVAPRWILTAAHCVRKRLFARLGEHNLQQSDGSEIEFRIDFSIKHPRYDKKTVDNDVALLRLPREVERSNFIGYACLPERYQTLPTGHTCTIIGWGKKRHSDDAGTDVLHEAEVPIITNDKCRAVYHDYTITKNMFCAGHKRGRVDTCAGDSGGPLLCRDTTKVNSPWTIFGITSFGDGCGKKNKFGIYTKLPNYVDWVWSVINCDGNCRT